ncbi:T9SS type B sorting domain-containing protein [Flavobacterium sp. LMO8]|uniref:T9SS type B sorting domain-containing protein n=1 Tax=Flavobacterium sp. LMO8 TaxID=2654244 RepID=UPI001290BF69|nr:gliding motility-associated C-terminal domain-containing protein [Flavobacterium sp. LMO8]MQP25894.1 T9SS type B sorting domain-containing protein [Flavobacterium sp. LMO8]
MNFIKKILFIIIVFSSCSSFSQVLINEIMFMPGANYSTSLGGDNTNSSLQSMYNTASSGSEWIELYNPDPCNAVDLSCYILGSNTSASNQTAFALPAGTVIPPLGFLVIGGANAPNVDINLSTLVGTSRHIGTSRWHLENGCGYILLASPTGVVLDAVYWSQNDANDLTAGTSCGGSFDNDLSIPAVCSPSTTTLPQARDIAGIEYAGNFGQTAQGPSVIGKTIRRATDGSTTWGLSSTGGTPKACNGVCAINTSLVLNSVSNNSPICSGDAIFTLNGTPNATVTYTINAGSNQTVVLNSSGNATVTIINPSSTVTMQLISINDASCTVSLTNSSVVTIGAANAGVITGDQTLCANASTSYTSNGDTGGTWSSSNTAVATVSSSGVVTAVSSGTATISYTVGSGACQSISTLLVSVSDPLQATITSTDNSNCGTSGGGCTYTGPSVVINELMIDKSGGNTIVARSNLSAGDEWIELYNPNPCQSIDLGCYMLANYSNESSGAVSEQAILFLPPGTTIPPLGFLTIGGANSNANLRPSDLINGFVGNRLYLPGGIFEGGWIGIFDSTGTPIDAVYWMDPSRNINSGVATLSFTTSPGTIASGAAPLSCPYSGTLPTARAIANASGPIDRIGGIAQDSRFQSRTTDAGTTWSFNIVTSTQGACNATCTPPFVPTSSCNGTATATPTNGTAPFSYLWNAAAANQITQTATGLCSGDYSVVVTDANGCQTTLNVTVMDAPIAAPTYTAIQPTCSSANGSVTVSTPVNEATTTYTITGISPVVAAVTNATGVFTGLNPGNYELFANVGSCVTPVTSITINAQPATPSIPIVSVTAPTCSANGFATVTNYVGGLTYVFTPSGPTVDGTGIISGMTIGTNYVVSASNGSCASADTAQFAIAAMLNTPSIAIASVTVQPTCPDPTGTIVVTAPLGGTLEYSIDNGNNYQSSTTFSGLAPNTSYTIIVRDSSTGCISSASALLNVDSVPPSPIVSTVSGCNGAVFEITASVATGTATYEWYDSSSNLIGTTATIVITASGTYEVRATVNSCTTIEFVTVDKSPCVIPKGVSPNNDGLNDTWNLSGLNAKKVQIFNRYGVEVYSKSDYTNEWEGKTNSGDELPDGTYYYVVSLPAGEVKTGWVYINKEN